MARITTRKPVRGPLTGKVALVTGSSRGIGAAIALRLARDGADIVVHSDIDRKQCEALCRKIRSLGCRASYALIPLGPPDAPRDLLSAATRELDRVDILVSNVAVQFPSDWQAATDEDFDRQVAINFRSALRLIQLATPAMVQRRWGRIITVGSVQEDVPNPAMLVYGALKAAQVHWVRNLARQLAPTGVTVNNVSPGVIDTDRSRARLADRRYRKKVLAQIPAGYVGSVDDCAHAAAFLANDAARYITGITLRVDGGMSL
ncbi:MAG: SDR family NAD(P)-dependent oxidoreductase [Opitutaceae bacterium]